MAKLTKFNALAAAVLTLSGNAADAQLVEQNLSTTRRPLFERADCRDAINQHAVSINHEIALRSRDLNEMLTAVGEKAPPSYETTAANVTKACGMTPEEIGKYNRDKLKPQL